jgi:hypothetical protein
MAVTTITPHPTISNPDARKRMLREAACQLDEWGALLRCAADSAACSNVEEELVASLYKIHGEMKQRIETVIALA